MASRTRELESPWEYCAQILPPPSKLSQHTVQEARWNNELLLLPGQTKPPELEAKAVQKDDRL